MNDDGVRLNRRSVLQTGAALLTGGVATGTATASDQYGDVIVGQQEAVDRANIHHFEESTDSDAAVGVPDVWGATAHAEATADEAGDSVWAWSGTGYSFDLLGKETGTAQITVTGDYSASLDGAWDAAATGTIEVLVSAVTFEDGGFTLEPFDRTTVLDSTAGSWPKVYRDQPFAIATTVDLEPGTDYAVTLRARADAESSGGTATADLFSFDEDEGFQGYVSWDEITIDWL